MGGWAGAAKGAMGKMGAAKGASALAGAKGSSMMGPPTSLANKGVAGSAMNGPGFMEMWGQAIGQGGGGGGGGGGSQQFANSAHRDYSDAANSQQVLSGLLGSMGAMQKMNPQTGRAPQWRTGPMGLFNR